MMHRRSHYIYPDLDTLAAAFVCDLNRFLAEKAMMKSQVHIALSGGSTPLAVFAQLARSGRPEEWAHVHLYWGDERCVPPGHAESNYGNALKHLITPLGIPPENIHRIRGEDPPEKEAERYGRWLSSHLPVENGFPVFDSVWLGLGEDGHTASIFPHQIEFWKSDRTCVVAEHPTSKQKRITITGGVINAARHVAFLVSGKSKSQVVNEIVMKEGQYLAYPAFYVAPHSGNIEWYLDMEATSWM